MGKLDAKLTLANDGQAKSILERVYRGMVFSSKDWGQNAFDIALYGIVAGWNFEEYPDIEFEKFGLTKEDCLALQEMHEAFIKIQNKHYR